VIALLVVAAALAAPAHAQPPLKTDVPTAREEKDKDRQAAKPPPRLRPRVTLKPKGGTGSAVGDDVPGGGATSAEPSKGGTPSTPSGSFTGKPPTAR
jgi:hypothetical protein